MSVYFARVGEYVKIGYSDDPMARSTTITRTGKRPDDVPKGAEVDLIGWVPGDVWREGQFHAQHMEHRVVGEWFRLEREYAQELIWADPRGVDIRRMSALAVFASMRYPEATRADIEAAGIPVEGAKDVKAVIARLMDPVMERLAKKSA